MHAIVLVATTLNGTQPTLSAHLPDHQWLKGPLRRSNSDGAHTDHSVAHAREEMPLTMVSSLDRLSVDLWDTPIQLEPDTELVGVEYWISGSRGSTDVAVLHLVLGESDPITHVESLLRSSTEVSQHMFTQVFDNVTANDKFRRGVGVILSGETNSEEWVTVDSAIIWHAEQTPTNESLLHGRMTHSALIAAIAHFSVKSLSAQWPKDEAPRKEWEQFRDGLQLVRQNWLWPVVSMNVHAQAIYEVLRARLGVMPQVEALFSDARDYIEVQQTKAANKLNVLVAVTATGTLIVAVLQLIETLVAAG
jgi:hypothetical protein